MGSDNDFNRKRSRLLVSLRRLATFVALFFVILCAFQNLDSSMGRHHELNPSTVIRKPLETITKENVTGWSDHDDQNTMKSSGLGSGKEASQGHQLSEMTASESSHKEIADSEKSKNVVADKSSMVSSSCAVDGGKCLGLDTVLLIICANRPDYLRRTLEAVLRYHPKTAVPIVISEDGHSAEVSTVVSNAQRNFKSDGGTVDFVHEHHPRNTAPAPNGYFKLASHYKWALEYVFEHFKSSKPVKRVIILEEDLEISPDFFEYFGAVMKLVDEDGSLLAASAFNDNGYAGRDNTKLYRSDFFPGLGWMMSVKIWSELRGKWPKAYWDDWLREPKQRLDRHTIRPEVCRTFHFGTKGVSNAQYSTYLNAIKLNKDFVKFGSMDLSYLQKNNWDHYYVDGVKRTKRIQMSEFERTREKEVHVVYSRISEGFEDGAFGVVARWSGAMNNIKAMVPRTAYRGIVSIWKDDKLVHLVPTSVI